MDVAHKSLLSQEPTGSGDDARSPEEPVAEGGSAVPKGHRSRVRKVAIAAILLVATVAASIGLELSQEGSVRRPSITSPLPVGTSAAGGPTNAVALARSAIRAVVDVNSVMGYEGLGVAGTGIVISSNGVVLTNNHVIEGATAIKARDVENGRTYRATVLGYDRSADIAVLRLVGASHLASADLGDSSVLRPGAPVVAVGNAGGVGGTPTFASGSVSALNQPISAYDEMTDTSEELSGLIETNTAVASGDSGGPLINTARKVVGMVTAGSTGYERGPTTHAGFAIPINVARTIAGQIESEQPSSSIHVGPTPFLGVQVQPAPGGVSGSQIVGVVSGGPADRAGLGPGDIITALGGQGVSSQDALSTVLLELAPGATVQVSYLDSYGLGHQVTVVLGSGPPQ